MEEYIQRLDEYFEGKKDKDKRLIFLVAFVAVAYIIYLLVNPSAVEVRENVESELNGINKELNDLTNKPKELNSQIARLNREIQEKQSEVASVSQKNSEVSQKVKELSKLLAGSNINVYLNDIARDALDTNVTIIRIDNMLNQVNPLSFAKLYDVNVTFETESFNNIVQYTRRLEESIDAIDISDIDMKVNDKGNIYGHINISSWGVRYE